MWRRNAHQEKQDLFVCKEAERPPRQLKSACSIPSTPIVPTWSCVIVCLMVCVNVWVCCQYCASSVNYENAVSSPRIDFFYLEKRGKTQIMGCFLIAAASPWQQEATAFVCVAAKTGVLRRRVSQWHTTLITSEKWVKHCWVRHCERTSDVTVPKNAAKKIDWSKASTTISSSRNCQTQETNQRRRNNSYTHKKKKWRERGFNPQNPETFWHQALVRFRKSWVMKSFDSLWSWRGS